MERTSVVDLLNGMTVEDAIASLLEVRLPLVIDDELDFLMGTWRGLPIHPKEVGQMENIINSLTDDQKTVIKYSALLVNWGRQYEIRRLLQTTSLGNLSSATAVLVGSDGDETVVDESNQFVAESNNNN